MKAFLSHSSKDKAFVEAVANELTRQYCVFDKNTFDTGEDFRKSIRLGLDKSTIFVLFASKNSLDAVIAPWVSFEIDEAELRLIRGNLRKVVVVIIDESITYKDLPEWLQRGKVPTITAPKMAAREVLHYLYAQIRETKQAYFFGRALSMDEAQKTLLSFGADAPPRIFSISGLAGIGRRTFCKHVAENLLDFPRQLILKMENGEDIASIAIKLAEEVEAYADQKSFEELFARIKSKTTEELRGDCARYLSSLIENRELPVFFDKAGMIDSAGNYSHAIKDIVQIVLEHKALYLALITERHPKIAGERDLDAIPQMHLNPLKTEDIRSLVGKISSETVGSSGEKLKLSAEQIGELAEYIRGYPPACYFAIELIRRYGVDIVLQNKHPLVEFRTSQFLRTLASREYLTGSRKDLLYLLASYNPLPLNIIGSSLGIKPFDLAEDLAFLIDSAFVIPDEDGLYWLADPLVDAVFRVFNSNIDHARLAEELSRYLADESSNIRRLELTRHHFRALARSGAGEALIRSGNYLISDIIRLMIDSYHSRDYSSAIKYGKVAIEKQPNNINVHSHLARAYIHEGSSSDYEQARREIEEIRHLGDPREAYFLEGFLQRNQGNTVNAIRAYEEALRRGRSGTAIHRELAGCYFTVGDLASARKHIEIARARAADNKFVIDLQVLIAINQRDEEGARLGIALLKEVDDEEFYFHRLSCVEYIFGAKEKAYTAAAKAVEVSKRPTFAIMANLVKCEISVKKYDDAIRHIDEIDRRFKSVNQDFKIGLRCKWELAQENYDNALGLSNRIARRDAPVHMALRLKAIEGLTKQGKQLSAELVAERESLAGSVGSYDLETLDGEYGVADRR